MGLDLSASIVFTLCIHNDPQCIPFWELHQYLWEERGIQKQKVFVSQTYSSVNKFSVLLKIGPLIACFYSVNSFAI